MRALLTNPTQLKHDKTRFLVYSMQTVLASGVQLHQWIPEPNHLGAGGGAGALLHQEGSFRGSSLGAKDLREGEPVRQQDPPALLPLRPGTWGRPDLQAGWSQTLPHKVLDFIFEELHI